MRLASFAHARGAGFGVVRDDHVVDLSGDAPTLRAALAAWGVAKPSRRAALASTTMCDSPSENRGVPASTVMP